MAKKSSLGSSSRGSMGKQSKTQLLPHRSALNLLTKGDPVQRSMGNYAKLSPADASGVGQMELPDFVSGLPPVKR